MVPLDTLRIRYFAHIHSSISYGTIFWGSSSYANKVFILQKKIITNAKSRDSCREVFKNMEIMTYSQYIGGFFKKFPNFYIFAGNGEGGRSSNWSCLRVSCD